MHGQQNIEFLIIAYLKFRKYSDPCLLDNLLTVVHMKYKFCCLWQSTAWTLSRYFRRLAMWHLNIPSQKFILTQTQSVRRS